PRTTTITSTSTTMSSRRISWASGGTATTRTRAPSRSRPRRRSERTKATWSTHGAMVAEPWGSACQEGQRRERRLPVLLVPQARRDRRPGAGDPDRHHGPSPVHAARRARAERRQARGLASVRRGGPQRREGDRRLPLLPADRARQRQARLADDLLRA